MDIKDYSILCASLIKDDRDTSALYTLGLAELVSVRRPDSQSFHSSSSIRIFTKVTWLKFESTDPNELKFSESTQNRT